MVPATHIVHAFAQLTLTAIDVTVFFVLVRMVRRWYSNRVLAAFDQAGSLLVDSLQTRVVQWWGRCQPRRRLSQTQQLLLSLLLLLGFRIVIVLVVQMVAPS